MKNLPHVPILLDEVAALAPKGKAVYLDLTLGRAGHARRILGQLVEGSLFIGVDRDETAIRESKALLQAAFPKIAMHFLHCADSQAIGRIRELGIASADFILMDIGVSSPQFDDPERGFSYRFDGPLDMRMDVRQGRTAADILNQADAQTLETIFSRYGQCPSSRLVARNVLLRRRERPFRTTLDFVDFLERTLPSWEKSRKGHPAKQYFLALRYAVNREPEELEATLQEALDFLAPSGRLVVLSFNFLEDRIVKEMFREKTRRKSHDKYRDGPDETIRYELLTRKPIVPTPEETERNPRSKSAILRAIERRSP